jgi:GT2 family glycosyltransferase
MSHDYVVVIPSCNRYDYLRQALQSVFRQTIRPKRVYVVDDASDDPRYLARGDELADDRVVTIRRTVNSKVATGASYAVGTARNEAIEFLLRPCSFGQYDGWLHFLDDDDMWRPNRVEEIAKAIRPDTAAIGTDAAVVDQDGTPIGFYGATGGVTAGNSLLDVTELAMGRTPLIISTVAMPMRVVRAIGLQKPTGFEEDWDYCRRAASHGRLYRLTLDLAMYRKGHAKEWSV